MAINFIKTSDINGGLAADTKGYIRKCEDVYRRRLAEAAEKIRLDAKDRPLVLLSGPSGSGKTTSAIRIAKMLRDKGMSVHTISMDNYFLPGGSEDIPLDENGNFQMRAAGNTPL